MKVLRHGDSGAAVTTLQQLLASNGYQITTDGIFGAETDNAVRRFQDDNDLVCDGIVGLKTWAALNGAPMPKTLSQRDIEKAAAQLGVDVATIQAVNRVESNGHGFLPGGHPVILYERHIMYRRLQVHGFDADEWARRNPALVNRSAGGYAGGTGELDRLSSAAMIDRTSALESCSWGAFQIMGYHWERLEYSSIDDFVTCMTRNEGYHLAAFARFVLADRDLHNALRARDWAAFARLYNGPAYRSNAYDTKLADAYVRYASHLVAT